MNITGKTICIRNRKTSDYAKETVWSLDNEVTQYDPVAGKVYNRQLFSIETLGGEHIGTCSLYNQTLTEIQLGIRIGDKNYWGKGYGVEAVSLLTIYCFGVIGIDRVWLKVLPSNTRAIRCYRKCGFRFCGRLALNGYEFLVMEKRKEQ